jgi:hypothetical protein
MTEAKKKDPAAVALGRKGGKKGGPARAARLTPEQRSESSRKAVGARWAKFRATKNNTNIADKGEEDVQAIKEFTTHAALPAVPAVGDHSENAIHALVEHIKVADNQTERDRLTDQLNRVIFHTQFKRYGG